MKSKSNRNTKLVPTAESEFRHVQRKPTVQIHNNTIPAFKKEEHPNPN